MASFFIDVQGNFFSPFDIEYIFVSQRATVFDGLIRYGTMVYLRGPAFSLSFRSYESAKLCAEKLMVLKTTTDTIEKNEALQDFLAFIEKERPI